MKATTTSREWAALAGRILLAAIFVHAGFGKITGFAGTVGYVASAGVPMPEVATALAIAAELGAGLMLVGGFKARYAALAIAAFTIVTTLVYHRYWELPAAQQLPQFVNFWKNVSIVGGLMLVYAFGPGRLSFDKS